MMCKIYDPKVEDGKKDLIDLIAESLWLENCNREWLAFNYGISITTLNRIMIGEANPNPYRRVIFRHHQFVLQRLRERIMVK